MTTDAEIALASSWQRTMTRDKSERVSSRTIPEAVQPGAGEEIDVGEPTVREGEPTIRPNLTHHENRSSSASSRVNEMNTDDREPKRVRFTESRGEKRQGENAGGGSWRY